MRALRSTIALLVVLVGLCAYIYFVTWKRPDSSAIAAKERVFASLPADKIDEIKVKSESGDTTTVNKKDGAWLVTMPLSDKGDEMDISAIATNLSTLEIARVVDQKPTDLKEYGLDMPRVEVDFKASGEKDYGDYHRLFIGAKSPTGGDLFVRRDNDPRVLLVAGYTDPIFNRSTFDLRSKTVMAFDREKVDRIDMTADGRTLELAKEGSDWKLTKPLPTSAEYGAVDQLLGRLQTAAMKSIVVDRATPTDLKKYGFDKPQGMATVSAGNRAASLVVGAKVNDFDVYVRDPSKPFVATIDSSFLKELQKGADEYRRKEIFAFRGFASDRLEFTRDGQTIVFEKVKAQGQAPDKWRRVSPNPAEPNQTNMESLIAKLENLRASSFLDSAAKTGLDKPSLTVYAKFDEGKNEERVSFVKNGTDVYAARAGQPGAVKVSPSEFDDAVKALDGVAK